MAGCVEIARLSLAKHFNPQRKTANLGVAYVARVADEMDCVWRPTPNDDVGLDGEIELGKGGAATGHLIKVQVKSGKSYIVRPRAATFEFLAEEDDLQYWETANVPVILVVYDPERKEGYWKPIRDYVAEHPEVKTKPHSIVFSRKRDKFQAATFLQLCGLAYPDEAELTVFLKNKISEPIFANLLPVCEYPEKVFSFQLAEKRLEEIDLPDNYFTEAIAAHGHGYLSFQDPVGPGSPVRSAVISQSVEFEPTLAYIRNPQTRSKIVGLWNGALNRYLRTLGLQQKDRHRFYFPPLPQDQPREVQWASVKRTPTRSVAYPYAGKKSGQTSFWVHHAIRAEFREVGGEWFLKLTPAYVFTKDGWKFIQSSDAGALSTSRMSQERNYQVLNHLYFWSWFLRQGDEYVSVPCGSQLLVVSGDLASGIANFGLGTDKKTLSAILNADYDVNWSELEAISEESEQE